MPDWLYLITNRPLGHFLYTPFARNHKKTLSSSLWMPPLYNGNQVSGMYRYFMDWTKAQTQRQTMLHQLLSLRSVSSDYLNNSSEVGRFFWVHHPKQEVFGSPQMEEVPLSSWCKGWQALVAVFPKGKVHFCSTKKEGIYQKQFQWLYQASMLLWSVSSDLITCWRLQPIKFTCKTMRFCEERVSEEVGHLLLS